MGILFFLWFYGIISKTGGEHMARTKKQRQFFDDYSVVLLILEKVFYYGSYSAQDFAEAGICKNSTYFERQKTLRYVFGDLVEETKNAKGQKAFKLRIDHLYNPHRAFLRFFALKSFTSVGRLIRICYILQKINAEGSCTVRELSEELDIISGGAESHSTVVRILNDMLNKGFLEKKGSAYSIAYDASKLKNSDIQLLIDFCTSAYPLSICGSGILNKIDQQYESPFLFKHFHLGQIFNDETIWKLMVCIQNSQTVNITTRRGIVLYDLLPYRIITKRETGRQYVFVVYTGEKDYDEYLILRLDRIKRIDVLSVSDMSDETLREKYETAFRYSFNGTTIIKRDDEPAVGTLIYDNSFEWNIKLHFPDCEPVSIDDTHSKVEVRVNSFIELKPWLRVNADKVRLAESSDGVVDKLRDELTKWREMYDIE